MKPIKFGDQIPDFSLKDQDGSLNYTREACYFRDLADVFDEALKICLILKKKTSEKIISLE